MKGYFGLLLVLLGTATLCAQVTATASGENGSGYSALTAAGFQLETPDCVHPGFGAHITQVFDEEIERNVFVFHSHITEDNDRCMVFDRVRMEIKGSASSIPELQHEQGDTTYYRWKFRLDENFIGASSFTHLYQNKAVGGDDVGIPVITITARANRVEVKHDGGNTGSDLGILAQADLSRFRGRWVEGYLRQVHDENGELDITLRDLQTGLTILEYSNDNIDLWRAGAVLTRPKWGVYRSKNTVLRDEEVRFADFCVSEAGEEFCPGEAVLIPDTEAPTVPTGLTVTGTTFTTIALRWEAATDEFGVTGYDIYANGNLAATATATEAVITDLVTATTYQLTVSARDEAGNVSPQSEAVSTTTDDASAAPGAATEPTPADGATGVNPATGLGWSAGANTSEFEVFFGTSAAPVSVGTQTENSFQPVLAGNTTYFWRVAAMNANGTTMSPVWSFTTGLINNDAPWYVYRANQRPQVETSFFELNRSPEFAVLDALSAEPGNPANSVYGFRSNVDGEDFRWRFALDDQDSTVTVVARLRGIDEAANGMLHIEVRANGWRQKVRINDGNIKLERSAGDVERDLGFDWNQDYHIVRIVYAGSTTTVYVDENETPFLTGESNDASDATYFEWGKSGGVDYGAFVDFMAVNITEASAPGEGTELPAGLLSGGVSTFSERLQAQVRVYPNPVVNYLTVEIPETEVFTGRIFSMEGRAVTSSFRVRNGQSLNVSSLVRGPYVLVIRAPDGRTARLKLMVE